MKISQEAFHVRPAGGAYFNGIIAFDSDRYTAQVAAQIAWGKDAGYVHLHWDNLNNGQFKEYPVYFYSLNE